MSFFGSVKTTPFVTVGKDIDTLHLCSVMHEIVGFFDLLGSLFKPIKTDVHGNVTKVQNSYNCNPNNRSGVASLIESERATKEKMGTIGVLWLFRALEFIYLFLKHLGDEPTREVREAINLSYSATLQRHHNFFSRKLFGTLSYASPSRVSFFNATVGDSGCTPEQAVAEMRTYVSQLDGVVRQLHSILVGLGVETVSSALDYAVVDSTAVPSTKCPSVVTNGAHEVAAGGE